MQPIERTWRGWLVLVAGLALGVSGCLDAPGARCADDTLCPNDSTCVPDVGCVDNEQLQACDDHGEGEACTLSDIGNGTCVRGQCLVQVCGNERLEPGEQCDVGDQVSGDGCSYDCQSTEICGNGYVDEAVGEQCDCGDGTTPLPAGCSEPNGTTATATCRIDCVDVRCGNALPDPGETCDDGNQDSGDGCSYDCASRETCGNDYPDYAAGEQCDDGAGLSHDGCASSCRAEVMAWSPIVAPALAPLGFGAHVAFDLARGRFVAFAGGDTSVLDATGWRQISHEDGYLDYVALAYDPSRGQVVRFGGWIGGNGSGNPPSDQTWVLDGDAWVELVLDPRPPGRADAALIYDQAHGELVLTGGDDLGGLRHDTWVLDGAGWSLRDDVAVGTATFAVGYDDALGAIVRVGGCTNAPWRWDGSTWSAFTTTNPPPQTQGGDLTFDPRLGVLVLTDARTCDQYETATWTLAGTTWSEAEAPLAIGRSGYDAVHGEVVTFERYNDEEHGPWAWTADGWIERTAEPDRYQAGQLAYDPTLGSIVLHDRLSTWTFDGATWHQHRGATPPQNYGASLAYDPASGRTILFGGDDGGPLVDETWAFDRSGWQQLPITGPAGRWYASMATDPAHGNVVLFGGNDPDGSLADTWIFEGNAWTQVLGAQPPRRADAGLAYDPSRNVMVLTAGADYDAGAFIPSPTARLLSFREDTWAFDGTSWTQLDLATEMPARAGFQLVSDLGLGQVLAIGGYDEDGGNGQLAEVWRLGPDGWLDVEPASPQARYHFGATYDPLHGETITLGYGETGSGTWRLRTDVPQPDSVVPEESCLDGALDADADGLAGCADPDCWARCTPTCRPGDDACDPAVGPRCGDGVCDAALEAGTSCPADCDACGDGVCAAGFEDRNACAVDCGTCGDGTCTADESALTCAGDCLMP